MENSSRTPATSASKTPGRRRERAELGHRGGLLVLGQLAPLRVVPCHPASCATRIRSVSGHLPIMSSTIVAAADGNVGELRRDPLRDVATLRLQHG